MKRWTFFVLLVAAILLTGTPSFGQNWWKQGITGQGSRVTKKLEVKDFDGITLAFSGNVYIKQGNTRSVQVEAQENIISNILTEVEGKHWKIRFDRPVRRHEGVKVYITMPTLTAARVSGSGNIKSDGAFTGLGDLEVSVSGSGDIVLDIDAKNVTSGVSGSGDIQLAGKAESYSIGISGAGDIDAGKLQTKSATIRISGSGDCTVNAGENLDIRISGSGDVLYYGNPRLTSKVSGSGDVVPKN